MVYASLVIQVLYVQVWQHSFIEDKPFAPSIKFDTCQSGWSITYIEGSQVIVIKLYYIDIIGVLMFY